MAREWSLAIDESMFRLHDRRGGDYCLAMTHEQVLTATSELVPRIEIQRRVGAR